MITIGELLKRRNTVTNKSIFLLNQGFGRNLGNNSQMVTFEQFGLSRNDIAFVSSPEIKPPFTSMLVQIRNKHFLLGWSMRWYFGLLS